MLDKLLSKYVPNLASYLLKVKNIGKCNSITVILYQFCKIRGYKAVRVLFPVGVQYIKELYTLLNESSNNTWHFHYIVLLWLSQALNTPFPLNSLDDSLDVKKTIYTIAIKYLENSGIDKEASCLVLSRLFSRDDGLDLLLGFLHHCESSWFKRSIFYKIGCLFSLSSFLKICPRNDCLQTVDVAFQFLNVAREDLVGQENSALRKLLCKCYTRLGIVLLPVNSSPNWKYSISNPDSFFQLPDDSNEEVHIYLEVIVDFLLSSVSDIDSFVRWSAAKGLAKIISRLPWNLAEQVIDAIIELMTENMFLNPIENTVNISITSPLVWHGAILFFAKLAGAGLIKYSKCLHILPLIEVVSTLCFLISF